MYKVIYLKDSSYIEDLFNLYEFIFFLFYCHFSKRFSLVSIDYLKFYDERGVDYDF